MQFITFMVSQINITFMVKSLITFMVDVFITFMVEIIITFMVSTHYIYGCYYIYG